MARKPNKSKRPLTLRLAYEAHVAPHVDKPRTRETFLNALNVWERLTGDEKAPGGPDVLAIDNISLDRFKSEMVREQYAPPTVNKVLRQLRVILRKIAAPSDGNPYGLGLIGLCPRTRAVAQQQRLPRLPAFADLDGIYGACAKAKYPKRRQAVHWWRALLVLLFNFGPRISDVKALVWTAIDLEKMTIRFVARKTSKVQVLPLNRVTAEHLKRIASQKVRDKGGLVFPGLTNKSLSLAEWREIQRLAGINPPFVFSDLRKLCATELERHSPGVGKWVLGHSVK